LTGQQYGLCATNHGLATGISHHQQIRDECLEKLTSQNNYQQQILQHSWRPQGSVWHHTTSCPGWPEGRHTSPYCNVFLGALQPLQIPRRYLHNNRCSSHSYCQPAGNSSVSISPVQP
jgi:hypothetical protein